MKVKLQEFCSQSQAIITYSKSNEFTSAIPAFQKLISMRPSVYNTDDRVTRDQALFDATMALAEAFARNQNNFGAILTLSEAANKLGEQVDERIKLYGKLAFTLSAAINACEIGNLRNEKEQKQYWRAADQAREMLRLLFNRHIVALRLVTVPDYQVVLFQNPVFSAINSQINIIQEIAAKIIQFWSALEEIAPAQKSLDKAFIKGYAEKQQIAMDLSGDLVTPTDISFTKETLTSQRATTWRRVQQSNSQHDDQLRLLQERRLSVS